jgi:ribonuclease Y
MDLLIIEAGLIAGAIGIAFGWVGRHYVAKLRRGTVEQELDRLVLDAKKEAHKIEEDALSRAQEIRAELQSSEDRLQKQEERMDKREDELAHELDALRAKAKELEALKDKLGEKEKHLAEEYEKIAALSREEAREFLFAKMTRESEEDLQSRMLKLSRDGETKLMDRARDILVNCVYRIANQNVASFTSSTVEIADEDIKGKIIGKEGRNIKTFERLAGVELLVDEVPNGIVVSCFDAVRRAIATNALEMLIADGRIQPAKIEECIDKAKKDIGLFIRKKGEEAVLACGLLSIPDELIPILGRLYFRTSYGQNVLDHSIEMAHIAGLLYMLRKPERFSMTSARQWTMRFKEHMLKSGEKFS